MWIATHSEAQAAPMPSWPGDSTQLVQAQQVLAAETPDPWLPPVRALMVGGCFACFPAGISGRGEAGDPIWAAAVVIRGRRPAGHYVTTGQAGGPYEAGLLALRMGLVLERVVRGLPHRPDVLLVDATGKDHPRRAGLALHLGAVLNVPTVGITHRPLLAHGEPPGDHQGATTPLVLDGEVVGFWLRTRPGVRPLAVHAAWRVDASTAVAVVLRCLGRWRTPEPLRRARHLARTARDREQ